MQCKSENVHLSSFIHRNRSLILSEPHKEKEASSGGEELEEPSEPEVGSFEEIAVDLLQARFSYSFPDSRLPYQY